MQGRDREGKGEGGDNGTKAGEGGKENGNAARARAERRTRVRQLCGH